MNEPRAQHGDTSKLKGEIWVSNGLNVAERSYLGFSALFCSQARLLCFWLSTGRAMVLRAALTLCWGRGQAAEVFREFPKLCVLLLGERHKNKMQATKNIYLLID